MLGSNTATMPIQFYIKGKIMFNLTKEVQKIKKYKYEVMVACIIYGVAAMLLYIISVILDVLHCTIQEFNMFNLSKEVNLN